MVRFTPLWRHNAWRKSILLPFLVTPLHHSCSAAAQGRARAQDLLAERRQRSTEWALSFGVMSNWKLHHSPEIWEIYRAQSQKNYGQSADKAGGEMSTGGESKGQQWLQRPRELSTSPDGTELFTSTTNLLLFISLKQILVNPKWVTPISIRIQGTSKNKSSSFFGEVSWLNFI